MSPVCLSQVVVKTKADYDAESKRGKLRSPKIAEFSISIIEGVSERLKVGPAWPPSPLPVTHHPIHARFRLTSMSGLECRVIHLTPPPKRSLIQLLPWRWPPNSSISPTSLTPPPLVAEQMRRLCEPNQGFHRRALNEPKQICPTVRIPLSA